MRMLPFQTTAGAQCLEVTVADTMLARMRGLLGRPALHSHEGFLLRPCNLVHTLGMRYPIDLVFLDRGGRVLKVSDTVLPGKARGHFLANCVLELAAGTAARSGIVAGLRMPIDAL
jgi:uncharacterized membrane protein (UPF0127 family)